jgi:Tol biopolymer transport system component
MRLPVGVSARGSLYYRAEDGRANLAISTLDPKRGVATAPEVVGPVYGVNRLSDWSPDGHWLAYMSDIGIAFSQRSAQLVIFDAKTGAARAVRTSVPHLGPLPRWSPDGRSVTMLAATRDEAKFTRLDVETGAAETFAVMQKAGSQVTEFEWTPDGRAMVYARDFRAVMRLDVESRHEQTLYETPEGLRINKPVLSHDGSRVAVVEWTPGKGPEPERIVLLPRDGGAAQPIFTAGPGDSITVAGWGPNDDVFVVIWKKGAGTTAALLRVPASGGTPVSTGLEAPDFENARVSRDGRHVAFNFGRYSMAQYVLENFLPPPRKAPPLSPAPRHPGR